MHETIAILFIVGLPLLAYFVPVLGWGLVPVFLFHDLVFGYLGLTWKAPEDAPYRNPPAIVPLIPPLVYLVACLALRQPVWVRLVSGAFLIGTHLLSCAAVVHGVRKQQEFNAEMIRRTGKVHWYEPKPKEH